MSTHSLRSPTGSGHDYIELEHRLYVIYAYLGALQEQKRTKKKFPKPANGADEDSDESGTRTHATFVTRKYDPVTRTWLHNQLGHLTKEFDERK